ncbi:MAG: rhodanese-like domain-containing protein [Gammaproteobacteria bacterium]
MHQLPEFIGNHLALSIAFVVLLIAVVVTEIRFRTGGSNDLSPLQTTQLMNHQNAVLVDVREHKEFQEGHIANAIHIPLSQINDQAKKLEKYKKRPIIAYCRTGSRSGSACNRLQKHGFESVYNLRGGLMAWQKDNLPVTRK